MRFNCTFSYALLMMSLHKKVGCNCYLISFCAILLQSTGSSPGFSKNVISSRKLVEVDLGFIHAFLASLSVIIVSELGDKTFFIAAILAMRNPRLTVFAGAMSALGLMTVLSGETKFVYIFVTNFNIKLHKKCSAIDYITDYNLITLQISCLNLFCLNLAWLATG